MFNLRAISIFLCCVYGRVRKATIGSGEDEAIAEMTGMVGQALGFEGKIEFAAGKPGGPPRKLIEVPRLIGTGWRPNVALSVRIGFGYKAFHEI